MKKLTNQIYNIDGAKLGLGFMRHNPNDFAHTQEVVDYAMSHRINYFEACSFYLDHKCESFLGQALKNYPRDSYFICDKYDIFGYDLPISQLEDFFNKQLETCGVDYFDVYLIQALDRKSLKKIKPVYDFFYKKKKEGKIKQFGFSFHDTAEILEQYLSQYEWDCCQIQLNYFDWYLGDAKNLYFLLKKYNLPIIVMGPFKGGTLTVKQPKQVQNFYPKGYLSHLAMHFLQTLPQVKIILSGAENIDMIYENMFLIDNYSFTKQDKEECLKIIQLYQYFNSINCSGCRYCEEKCPMHIQIAQTFAFYNKLLVNPEDKEARDGLAKLSKQSNSFFECARCGQCERRCPQHLPIISYFNNQLFTMRL